MYAVIGLAVLAVVAWLGIGHYYYHGSMPWRRTRPDKCVLVMDCVSEKLYADTKDLVNAKSLDLVQNYAPTLQALQTQCPAFVINLDRSPERLAKAIQRIRNAGFVNVTRSPGVDGSNPRALKDGWNRHGNPPIDSTKYDFAYHKLGKQGCFLSHADVLLRIITEQIPMACVFEDDVTFHPEFATLAPMYYNSLTPKDFDLLFMGVQLIPDFPVPTNVLVARGVPVYCCHAYVITLQGARRMYDSLVRSGTPVCEIDVMMIENMRAGRAPYVWYIWHGRKYPTPGCFSGFSRNCGLVFQDESFESLIDVPE